MVSGSVVRDRPVLLRVLTSKLHSPHMLFVIRCRARHGGQTTTQTPVAFETSAQLPFIWRCLTILGVQDEAQMVADRLAVRTDGLVDYEELYRLLLKTPPPQVQNSISITLSLLPMALDASYPSFLHQPHGANHCVSPTRGYDAETLFFF